MLGVGKRKARMQQKALDDLLMPDVSEMFASGSVKKVCFENGDKDLNVGFGTAEYSSLNCRYNVEQIGSSNWWHQIIVNNDGKPRINPTTVLPELYKVVDGETFTPIGLRTSKRNFYFFLRNQGKALQKLFVKGLRIYVEGQPVELIVRFCVGEFQQGMLNPRDKLASVIRKCVQVPLLNLNTIKNHPELSDITISLANVGCLNMLCEQLNEARKLLQPVKNLNLLNNEITNLKPFSSLRGFNISGIDLQFNKIEAIEEFQHLKHLYLQSIRITGNPVAKTPQFKEKLIAVLPTLKMIDSMDVEAAKVSRPEPLVYDNRNEAVVSTTSMIVIIRHHDVDDTFKADFSRRKIYGDTWTKVVVEHKGRFSKQVILNEMCSQLFNSCSFYPCYYTHDKKIDTFLLYQNFNALNVLIHNNLRMNIQSLKIKFELHLNYADHIDGQLNWRHKLNFVIRKRIVGQSLNLDNLADDSDLSNIIVPTTNSFGVFNVFTAANKINNQIISMSFQGNRISKVDGFEGMKFLPQLMSLDLRNNNIESFGEMCELPQIHELFLDKNPFCVKPEFYEEPWRYIQELKKCFPKLQYLDGRRIDVNTGLVFMRNFIVSPSAYTLTESFMKFYFEIYDSTSRASLNQLYNFNSAFTMAHSLASNRANHFVSNSTNSRNTLRDNIFNGDAITMLLESFPSTQHDFSTLCIDVPFMNDVNILIVVSGYFKEMGQSLNDDDVVYAFSRTFFLERMNKKQGAVNNTFKYFIKNEQLHVRNVNAEETNKAFKKSVVGESELNEICYDLMPLQFQEEEANIIVLSGITQLKDQWCKRLLQDSNWDIKTALGYFNDLADRNIWILDDFNFVV